MLIDLTRIVPKPVLFYQGLAFTLTFLIYVMVHAMRKSISSAAPLLKAEEFGYPTAFFGAMDVVFMISYAIAMLFTGILGDIYNPMLVVLLFVVLAAAVQCLCGILMVLYTSKGFHYLYYVLNGLNGAAQSAIWPVLVKIMGDYFDQLHSGLIFGFWATNSAVGNIVGSSLASLMIVIFGGTGEVVIASTFISPCLIVVIVTLISLFMLPSSIESVLSSTGSTTRATITSSDSDESHVNADLPAMRDEEHPIKFWRAWLIPGVLIFALTYACVKGVNYAMFFWLPLYLNEHADIPPEKANLFDMLYNIGTVFGCIICGWVSDYMARVQGSGRSPSLFFFIFLALIPVSLLHVDDPTVVYLSVMLLLAGFLIGGASNLVGSVVCTDIGRQDALKGNRKAVSQVTGIIDGTGACGAAVQQGLVSWIATYSWDGVFILLPVSLGLSCILLGTRAYKETKGFLKGFRSPRQQRVPTDVSK
ncbi:Glycerol-3-phosphate transporter, putative [Perkinsus marinus ATCC 50983]|uniref:Glycerol-3-phosphate transporter, putative n=2 Tax=Perkinsus marinus (strain ATCC 50983 / TXsc) TaxID=423536 RepID=C5KPI0_PERM5|nr:Glycerol-3-phosphate transporter, putative [Perkinsus marinus ATCC 50983]EER13609.1 Glycerol-3-phosphate transporter, putative [Perkinsus marinus ATCC 50983]|eukprot:XP_002781814.1 Glycerol-3-phosphate transporter, putative [Perkinsus marinus ATCC 50983]